LPATRSRGSKAGLREIDCCTLLDCADQYCSVLHTCILPKGPSIEARRIALRSNERGLKPWGVAGGTRKGQFYLGVRLNTKYSPGYLRRSSSTIAFAESAFSADPTQTNPLASLRKMSIGIITYTHYFVLVTATVQY
jgi:hypothetical protein